MFVIYSAKIYQDNSLHTNVRNELSLLGGSHSRFKDIQSLFQKIQGDSKLESEDALKALIKTYTGEAVYREIGSSLVNGNYNQIQGYLTSILFSLPKNGATFTYKDSKPLYRGVSPKSVNIEDYHANKIHYWPGFSSTSKRKDFAISRSKRGGNKGLIFEIYTST